MKLYLYCTLNQTFQSLNGLCNLHVRTPEWGKIKLEETPRGATEEGWHILDIQGWKHLGKLPRTLIIISFSFRNIVIVLQLLTQIVHVNTGLYLVWITARCDAPEQVVSQSCRSHESWSRTNFQQSFGHWHYFSGALTEAQWKCCWWFTLILHLLLWFIIICNKPFLLLYISSTWFELLLVCGHINAVVGVKLANWSRFTGDAAEESAVVRSAGNMNTQERLKLHFSRLVRCCN